MAFSRVFAPYIIGFTAVAFAMPQENFNRMAFQFYHLQSLWMADQPLYLAEYPTQKA